MSQDAEKIKRLVSFKQKLERKVEELESELKELQATLDAVNLILLEKGFKRAEITKPREEKEEISESYASQFPTEKESVIPLKAVSGELLATLHISGDSLKVVLAKDKNFTINTPPFTSFLVERVLAKMQEKDSQLVETGQKRPENIFSYNIVQEVDVIREIIIRHVDEDRLRELKSSIRWTLEKMYEKIKNQS